ncbi:hypothetical protein TUMSATVNIG1_60950 (plasmid) [Vibrio nigripulchritudo]|uniref:type IVB secretion system protein IcmW n=1 Tax=Vibrio nigripulchritudo TaxID=28173 RepID=UPI00190D5556|nr:hypothetical protein [Vibrio nigripulchritudo]BCL74111.1 hypothetical protein VNTUMSATTG_60480 [Vibrio nigripulchritudo]BDU35486.1 hypothetical protein TUMSATVNIG1_60950 [Vibrio nigripulchritudo]
MLSDLDLIEWQKNFDPSLKKLLELAGNLETWSVDDDPEILQKIDELSDCFRSIRTNSNGETEQVLHYEKLKYLEGTDLIQLQSQVGITRGVRLFGETCFVDREKGMQMLTYKQESQSAHNLQVGSSLLARRLWLLTRCKMLIKVFDVERRKIVIDSLLKYFEHENGSEEEKL